MIFLCKLEDPAMGLPCNQGIKLDRFKYDVTGGKETQHDLLGIYSAYPIVPDVKPDIHLPCKFSRSGSGL
jgi:hypothetical protein